MTNSHRCGPWALVTGASDGIGRAIAAKTAAEGINVKMLPRPARTAVLARVMESMRNDHGR